MTPDTAVGGSAGSDPQHEISTDAGALIKSLAPLLAVGVRMPALQAQRISGYFRIVSRFGIDLILNTAVTTVALSVPPGMEALAPAR